MFKYICFSGVLALAIFAANAGARGPQRHCELAKRYVNLTKENIMIEINIAQQSTDNIVKKVALLLKQELNNLDGISSKNDPYDCERQMDYVIKLKKFLRSKIS